MTNPLRTTKLLIAAAVIALVSLPLLAAPAGAHARDQSYLYLDVARTTLGGELEIAHNDLERVLGLDLGGDRDAQLTELLANADAIEDYMVDNISIVEPNWTIDFTELSLFEEEDGYAVFAFDVDTGGAEVPREFEVTFEPFLDEIGDRDHVLFISNDWDNGVFENVTEGILVFDGGSRTQTVDLGNTSQWNNFTGSVELGFDHIKTGPDHILFMLALVLPSVLVFSTLWKPAAAFGPAFWRVLKIMTMFTIAHSITFSLAGLDILPLPSPRITESIIALSIAAAALHNIRPIIVNQEWTLAFVFGLFHGMGFASLVESLDISRSTQLVSLLGRNVGIEIGQAVVIALVFPGLYLLRRTRFFQPFFVVMSVLLSIVSIGWGYERVFENEIGVSDIVDPLLETGTAIPAIIVFTIIAAVLERMERNAGRLLPVHDEATDSTGTALVDA